MPFPRQLAARRLLIGLGLLVALVAGVWWNSTRLNETERKLVGAWEGITSTGQPKGLVLLSDRNGSIIQKSDDQWVRLPVEMRWAAKPGFMVFRAPQAWSLMNLQQMLIRIMNGTRPAEVELVELPDDGFEMKFFASQSWKFHRATDPKLLAVFDRLSAGESP